MKFQLNESQSDIALLVKALQLAEQDNRAAKGDVALRALLALAAHALNESQSLMTSAVNSLEDAIRLRAGLQDSIGRHDEIVNAKNRVMITTADFLKSFLQQYTPRAQPTPAKKTDEVI